MKDVGRKEGLVWEVRVVIGCLIWCVCVVFGKGDGGLFWCYFMCDDVWWGCGLLGKRMGIWVDVAGKQGGWMQQQ